MRKKQKYTISNSVQISCSVVSDSFRPHELQHTRLPFVICLRVADQNLTQVLEKQISRKSHGETFTIKQE